MKDEGQKPNGATSATVSGPVEEDLMSDRSTSKILVRYNGERAMAGGLHSPPPELCL